MVSINTLLAELDERLIAERIGTRHDEARMRFALESNTVSSFDEFNQLIADYYAYHFSACVSNGGTLSFSEAASRAKELLENEYRRSSGNIVTAYSDANTGLNGGVRKILDIIAEGLKTESIERYIRDVFDHCVAPNSWEQKVELISQFIDQCGVYLSSSIRFDQPERYANDYVDLIKGFTTALQQSSSIFRRL